MRKLFDQATSKAELITVTADPTARQVIVTWRLEGRVNLPFKPKIKPYVVTTYLGLDDEGLICSQLDKFSVPGYDLLLSIVLGTGEVLMYLISDSSKLLTWDNAVAFP